MRQEIIHARQGHNIPERPYRSPRRIFTDEILAPPVLVTDYIPQPDGGGEPIPVGGTAQNGYTEPVSQWFRCRDCDGIVHESLLETHECSTTETEESQS